MKRIVAIILFLLPMSAFGWTRAADYRIARKSAELAPPDLRMVLQKFGKQYTKGINTSLDEEGIDIHRERLPGRIEQLTIDIVKMIRSGKPMASVAESMGTLVHLVGDANNPFHVSHDADLEASHSDFELYFERRLDVFVPVSYGIDSNLQPGPYIAQMIARTEKLVPLMNEEYFRGGERRDQSQFDDRSTAFGVASLCYSHAVTDSANLFYYIWRQAGGDVRAAR